MSRAAKMLSEFSVATSGPDTDALWLRQTLHTEEYKELIQALDEGDREHIARELADVVYVAYGTANAYGIDLDIALGEVHRANMRKVDEKIIRQDGKVMKGPNFRPPDMSIAVK